MWGVFKYWFQGLNSTEVLNKFSGKADDYSHLGIPDLNNAFYFFPSFTELQLIYNKLHALKVYHLMSLTHGYTCETIIIMKTVNLSITAKVSLYSLVIPLCHSCPQPYQQCFLNIKCISPVFHNNWRANGSRLKSLRSSLCYLLKGESSVRLDSDVEVTKWYLMQIILSAWRRASDSSWKFSARLYATQFLEGDWIKMHPMKKLIGSTVTVFKRFFFYRQMLKISW